MNSNEDLTQQKSFSKQQIRDSFNKAADSYDAAAIVQREVCSRLLERLEYIKAEPEIILDIGSGTGQGTFGLAQQYPNAAIISMDLAENMLQKSRLIQLEKHKKQGMLKQLSKKVGQWAKGSKSNISQVCADAEQLPFADASVDLIFSNLTIQWCYDLSHLFNEFRRVLKPGGFMLFTTFGTETLKELKVSWAAASDKVHVNNFVDMHDIGDALYNAQTENPVMDSEKIILNYPDIKQILLEIKAVGAHNQNDGRHKGLMGKTRLQAMYQAYEQFHTDAGYPVTYEVLYGHAWNPKTPVQATQAIDNTQQTAISLAQMKSQLKKIQPS